MVWWCRYRLHPIPAGPSQADQASTSQGNKGGEPVCKGMKPALAKGFRARALLLLLSLWHGHISAVPCNKGVGIGVNCSVWKSSSILFGGLRTDWRALGEDFLPLNGLSLPRRERAEQWDINRRGLEDWEAPERGRFGGSSSGRGTWRSTLARSSLYWEDKAGWPEGLGAGGSGQRQHGRSPAPAGALPA